MVTGVSNGLAACSPGIWTIIHCGCLLLLGRISGSLGHTRAAGTFYCGLSYLPSWTYNFNGAIMVIGGVNGIMVYYSAL